MVDGEAIGETKKTFVSKEKRTDEMLIRRCAMDGLCGWTQG